VNFYTLNCVSRIGLGCLVAALSPFAVAKGVQRNIGMAYIIANAVHS